MRLTLNAKLTVEQNAALYFERAKKAKKKLEGAQRALEMTRTKIAAGEREQARLDAIPARVVRKKEWYEKFRWFVSSDNILCVGGRDASTNEAIVKKHTHATDVLMHTDMAGSPFVVIKAESKPVPASTLEQAAIFTATMSRAWKAGLGTLEVFSAKPEQVSKSAQPGEFMGKGAFMVRGQVQYYSPSLELFIGKDAHDRIMSGPKDAVLAHCAVAMQLLQGNEKPSDIAKKLARKFDSHPDEILPLFPPGGVKLGKEFSKS